MRADRLISMLMLLQARGRMTSQQLAAELEVSGRTVYRDLEALSAAGVPIYAERGPHGGIQLVDRYRTDLTGLTSEEVRALFMISVPGPLAELGLGRELQRAMQKLSAALPPDHRSIETLSRQRIHLDATGWFQSKTPPPHLQTISHAVWQNCRLVIVYWYPMPFDTTVELPLEPLGLVAKASDWYLVGRHAGRNTAYQVSRVRGVTIGEDSFERPEGFDLTKFWRAWCANNEEGRPRYPVRVRMSATLASAPSLYLGDEVGIEWTADGTSDPDGWKLAVLTFQGLEDARGRLLALGGAVEVLDPEALRKSVADFAYQTFTRYRS